MTTFYSECMMQFEQRVDTLFYGATFSELKRQLDASFGNLDSHLKKLIAADYVNLRKNGSGSRPQTCYALTQTGRAALQNYIQALQKLLSLDAASSTERHQMKIQAA